MKLELSAFAALTGLACGALGQGTASWVLLPGSGTADGDYIIDPGLGEDDVMYKLGIDLKPSPGETLGDGSFVAGFGAVIANIIGTRNWDTRSTVTWTVNPDLIFLTGDLTHKDDETQDLYDMNAGQIPGFGPFSSADPIWIVTINWHADDFDFAPFDVTATIDTQDNDTIQAYIKKPGSELEEPQAWVLPDGLLAHHVGAIPTPNAGGLLVLSGLWTVGRRRR